MSVEESDPENSDLDPKISGEFSCVYGKTTHHGNLYRVIEGDEERRACAKHLTVTNILRRAKGQPPLKGERLEH